MKDKVSVVIPVYGQWELVCRNVAALLRLDRQYLQEIIIVDDCSQEPSPEWPDCLVTVIVHTENKGYAATANTGLKAASAPVVVLLDSDACPVNSFVPALLGLYAKDKRIGCIGFSTINENGGPVGNYQFEPSVPGFIIGQALESRLGLWRLWRKRKILPHSCAVSFRKACLADMQYFNSADYPVLEADVDLSMRIHRSAWKLSFTNEISICHEGGHSYKVNNKRVLMFHASRWRLLRQFGQIKNPLFARQMLKTRVWLEIGLLYLLCFINYGSKRYHEKRIGRVLLLQQIKSYPV